MHRRNVFAGPYLDRVAHLRHDPQWLATALADPRSRAVPVWNSRSLIDEQAAEPFAPAPAAGDLARAAFIHTAELDPAAARLEDFIFLGSRGDAHYFAYEVHASEPPLLHPTARFQDLRTISSRLDAEEAGLLAYARAMISWRQNHRFCGKCGAGTAPDKGGHVLKCTRTTCGLEQFPRLDPAIIVLVSDGDHALLGRQASWPPGRYSTIAGFVEPGESLEDAVVREVAEETGVDVQGVHYHSSQPWPFPSSLMLGFLAQARTRDIHLRDQELEDARWFSRADILAGHPLLPPLQSISFSLIEHWFDAAGGRRLRDFAGGSPWPAPR
jgi:NAD+ diphosphatase